MQILMCVKAVPSTLVSAEGAEDGVLSLNPYDTYSLKKLAAFKKTFGGEITCLCMGPKNADKVLTKCLALGADKAVLVSDPQFQGADTYATSYVLSKAAEKFDADIIVCGGIAIDGETGQVPCGIAARLETICLSGVTGLEKDENGALTVEYQDSDTCYLVQAATPIVLSFDDYTYSTAVSLLALKRARKAQIAVWDVRELGLSAEECGQKGSKTKVLRSQNMKSTGNRDTQYVSASDAGTYQFLLEQIRACLGS